MSLQALMDVVGLALAIGGVVELLRGREKRRRVVVVVVLSALAVLSAAAIVDSYVHRRKVEEAQARVVGVLGTDAKTIDDIYAELRYTNFPLMNEALDSLVSRGVVGDRVLELKDGTGVNRRVRVYYRI